MEKCIHGVYNPFPGFSSALSTGHPEFDMSNLPQDANTNCSGCMANAKRLVAPLSPAMTFLESVYWAKKLSEEGQGLLEMY